MKKLILMAVIAMVSMTSFRAVAQPPTQAFGVYFTDYIYPPNTYGLEIETFNIGISSAQPPALFQPPYTFTNPGSFSQPWGLFTLGGYWVTPSLATPLTISIGPGYTAVVRNHRLTNSPTVRVCVEMAPSNGVGNNTTVMGPAVTIPAQSAATLQVPTIATTYTISPLPNLHPSEPTYRVPIRFYLLIL